MIAVSAKEFRIEETDTALPVLVMYHAAWCSKCSMMRPVVERLERFLEGRMVFYEAEIKEEEELEEIVGAGVVPTFVVWKDKEVQCVMQGIIEEELFEERLRELL